MTTPIPDSYWVDGERLLAGEYPGAKDRNEAQKRLQLFAAVGISSFIDLTEEGELVPYDDLLWPEARWERLPIRDLGVPSVAAMVVMLDHLDEELARGKRVYVHCWGGHGRTGTLIGCWMVRHGLGAEQALERIAALRAGIPDAAHPSPETEAQRQFVRSFAV